jgi:hypothetical protein
LRSTCRDPAGRRGDPADLVVVVNLLHLIDEEAAQSALRASRMCCGRMASP